MKRTKLGDAYAFKTEKGYRIIHWAYFVDKRGEFVRVMPGFYDKIPEKIEEILDGECSYIIWFLIKRLYRTGLLELLGNFPISEKHPLPKKCIQYVPGGFWVCDFEDLRNTESYDGTPREALPETYKDLKLMYFSPDPITFLYYLSTDFDIEHWELINARKNWNKYDEKYGDLIFGKKDKK